MKYPIKTPGAANKFTSLLFVFALSICTKGIGQDTYPRNPSVDVAAYMFHLTLKDTTNHIQGKAQITVDFLAPTSSFALDLIEKTGRYGMEITSVMEDGLPASYEHKDNKITIRLKAPDANRTTFTISYGGIPERGLVIDTTKFGQRSFFGDNWPNLARHWLPSVDHPYDKASITFKIEAPDYYDVVATGEKIEESHLGNGHKLTIYHEPAPVAMKVVTIGVTKFASRLLGEVKGIPVTAWVYPENRLEGFSDYDVATKVLNYFMDHVGPYSYAKLANMQAKTQWGGLENAGTIAYFENSVTGKNEVEGLIAHEIAHQWFGNSATENDWNHVWLSEGFATYFAILYLESAYGEAKRKEELALDKEQIFAYYAKNPSPIVDPSITDPLKVLSVNTYQKAGWVLHMLRHLLGDDTFWKGIRAYYAQYQNSNAMTKDFQKVMEQVSGMDLSLFFKQWIFTKGHPELQWDWSYEKGKVTVRLKQGQAHHTFAFPLEIGTLNKGKMVLHKVQVNGAEETFGLPVSERPESVVLDPNLWLLYQAR
jgi:aminopeptidase N